MLRNGNDYLPWRGKKDEVDVTCKEKRDAEDTREVPRPKKYLPWVGKRSTKPRGEKFIL